MKWYISTVCILLLYVFISKKELKIKSSKIPSYTQFYACKNIPVIYFVHVSWNYYPLTTDGYAPAILHSWNKSITLFSLLCSSSFLLSKVTSKKIFEISRHRHVSSLFLCCSVRLVIWNVKLFLTHFLVFHQRKLSHLENQACMTSENHVHLSSHISPFSFSHLCILLQKMYKYIYFSLSKCNKKGGIFFSRFFCLPVHDNVLCAHFLYITDDILFSSFFPPLLVIWRQGSMNRAWKNIPVSVYSEKSFKKTWVSE